MVSSRACGRSHLCAAPWLIWAALGVLLINLAWAAAPPTPASPWSRWTNGPPADPAYFPIAVWLQDPKNALRFKAAGINLYVGLWRGPTRAQLSALTEAGMPVICGQNAFALEHKDDPIVVGWMHGDEPDNAQSLPSGRGYGPPIAPEKIVADYKRIQEADPSRPILLNLGQGVAWDNYIGRGVRRRHPEDYPEYLRGCDIASFDIYPAVHDSPEVAGKLEFVAQGVERLVQWTRGEKVVWNCIECTRISNVKTKPMPDQVRAEVWMALIRGSRGLIYFVHQFKPNFREAALLDDPEMLAAVTRINQQIRALAPVLNSGSPAPYQVTPKPGPVAALLKRREGALYLFTVNLRSEPVRGSFHLDGAPQPLEAKAEALEEGRTVPVKAGLLEDDFASYGVHIYRMRAASLDLH